MPMGVSFNKSGNHASPECAAALVVLHRWLDGDAIGVPPGVAAHAAVCPECGGRFAASGQLSAALVKSVASLPVPAGLADRIVGEVLADYRRRRVLRQLSFAGAGIAATLMAAIWLDLPAAPPNPTLPPTPALVERDGPPAPDLRRDLVEAGEAVAALTRRAADEVADAGKQLLPQMPPAAAPPEPVRPLDGAGAALADGFEPVATSARRAARLVWREFSMEDEKK